MIFEAKINPTDMKAIIPTLALLTVPALVSFAAADTQPGAMKEYLPVGSLTQGRVVRAQLDEAIVPYLKKVDEKFAKLPEADRKAMLESRDQEQALEYDPRLWENKGEYEKYLSIWKKTKLVEQEPVALGLNPSGEENMWMLNSATVDAKTGQPMPLTLSALQYNSKDNTWVSSNGVLKSKGKIKRNDKFVYGPMAGEEWNLETSDGMTKLSEDVTFAKSPDGKYVYAFYRFSETMISTGAPLANGSYVLRLPAGGAKTAPIGGAGRR